MKKIISAKIAGNILIIFLLLLFIFHILILLRIVPYEIVWGGQIRNSSSLIIFEVIALFLTLVFILIISMKIGYIKAGKFRKIINIGVWFIFVYFLLNIIGNLASGVSMEKLIFAPITIIITLLAFILAVEE